MVAIQRTLFRILNDIRQRRNVEVYVVSGMALILALLGVMDNAVSEEVKSAVILAALALLVFNISVPEKNYIDLDDVLKDRSAYPPLPARIKGTRQLWIYAASAVNILNADNLQAIRQEILNYKDGQVRVIIQDPNEPEGVRRLIKQLDESADYPVQHVGTSIQQTLETFARIQRWNCPGEFEYRFLPDSPGFSLVVIDPDDRHRGVVIPEFYGFHNEHTGSRMHIEITRELSLEWYDYWVSQFDYMWNEARRPDDAGR